LISGWSSSYSLLGDALALLSAICWGSLFAVTERVVRDRDSAQIALGQVVCTVPLGLAALALSSSPLIPSGGDVWALIVVTAGIVTVLGVIVQMFAQKYLSATTVALLFAAQTPIALLAGVLVTGDALSLLAVMGLTFAFSGIALGMRLGLSEARYVNPTEVSTHE
jgi:drug/metabolite transporter (DMT)-like permease